MDISICLWMGVLQTSRPVPRKTRYGVGPVVIGIPMTDVTGVSGLESLIIGLTLEYQWLQETGQIAVTLCKILISSRTRRLEAVPNVIEKRQMIVSNCFL